MIFRGEPDKSLTGTSGKKVSEAKLTKKEKRRFKFPKLEVRERPSLSTLEERIIKAYCEQLYIDKL